MEGALPPAGADKTTFACLPSGGDAPAGDFSNECVACLHSLDLMVYRIIQRSRRRRHPAFYRANAWTKRSFLEDRWFESKCWDCILDKLVKLCEEYKSAISDKAIALTNESMENVLMFLYYTRFSKRYRRFIYRRFKGLRFKRCVLLTITVDWKACKSIYFAYKALLTAWNRVNTWLKRRFKFWFIRVLEIGSEGRKLHLHVLILGRAWIGKKEDIQRVAGCGFVDVRRVDGDRPVYYLLKYLNKMHKFPVFQAVLWALNARFYSYSRNLMLPESRRSGCLVEKWFLLGVFSLLGLPDSWKSALERHGCLIVTYADFIAVGLSPPV